MPESGQADDRIAVSERSSPSLAIAAADSLAARKAHASLLRAGYVAVLVDDTRIEVFLEPGQSAPSIEKPLADPRGRHGRPRRLRLLR